MRKGSLVVTVIVALGVALALGGALLRRHTGPRTVVLITIDTLRADHVGAQRGRPSLTPEIDALASRGTTFVDCWTTAPLTVPAHASLLTGLAPPNHGLRSNHPAGRLPPRAERPYATLAESYQGHGYPTGAFVSAGVLRRDRAGLDAGFDVYDEVGPPSAGVLHDSERRAEETVGAALDWVRAQTKPSFLWVHLFDPHGPYDAPSPWGAGPDHHADATGYRGEISYVDHWVGQLLDGLHAAGHDDAVVVLTSDHGEGLGEHGEATHGFLLHEATLRVPLVIVAEGVVEAGAQETRHVSLIDVAPTLRRLAGFEMSDAFGGGAGLFGKERAAPKAQYAETLYGFESCGWAQTFATRSGHHKFVDAGSFVYEIDLATDPQELAPVRQASVYLTSKLAAQREMLRAFAGQRPLASLDDTGPAPGDAPAYYGPVESSGASILPVEENVARFDPYDRMPDLLLLDAGRSLLALGQAEAARKVFATVADADPRNPQARRWLARALLAPPGDDPAAAYAAFVAAFDLGWRTPDAVFEISKAAVLANPDGDDVFLRRALAFQDRARSEGVPVTGATLAWRVWLLALAGETDAAREAYDAARAQPADANLERFLDRTNEQLGLR